MGFLDGVSATKVIEASMCFATMQEKIRTQQHSSWRMFVLFAQEDFEWICYNALNCNHKRSIIWAAANDLIRRGKNSLEQYERWGESLVSLNKTGGSHASSDSKLGVSSKLKTENVGVRVCQRNKYPVSERLRMAIPSATTGSPESKPPASGAATLRGDVILGKDICLIQGSNEEKREDKMARGTTPFLTPVLDVVSEETLNVSRETRDVISRRGDSEGEPLAVRQVLDIVDVEGARDVDSCDYRGDLDGEATECSSSYDSAGSALEGDVGSDGMQSVFETQSDLRDGNGAGGLLEFEDVLFTSERATNPLDPEWKLYRRGIEWRCHWLELKTNLIKAKLYQYDKSLRSILSGKIWKWEGEVEEGTSARISAVKILRNHPVIHRKHRRRAEDARDLDLRRHPVFSRYEKRKIQRKSVDGMVDDQEVPQTGYESDEPEGTSENVRVEQQPVAGNPLQRQNSTESMLITIESMQLLVKKMRGSLEGDSPGNSSIKTPTSRRSPRPRPRPRAKQGDISSAQDVRRGHTPSTPSPKTKNRVGTPLSSTGAGRTASGSARRKTSDYDINDMVMPRGAGTTKVENVRHVDIETPQWRPVGGAEHPGPESSSEETTDEAYQNRHARMEAEEHIQRNVLPLKKSARETHAFGKGVLEMGEGKIDSMMTGKGGIAKLDLPCSSVPTGAWYPGDSVVPRRPPTKRSRRPARAFSVVQARSSDVLDVKPEVESVISEEDDKLEFPGAESGDDAPTPAEESPTVDRKGKRLLEY